MWFRSGKEFKENMESRALLIITGRFTLYSFKKVKRGLDHNDREAFVDAWLNERVISEELRSKIKLMPIIRIVNPNIFN